MKWRLIKRTALLIHISALFDKQAHDVRQVVLSSNVERIAIVILDLEEFITLLGKECLDYLNTSFTDEALNRRRELVSRHCLALLEEHNPDVHFALHFLAFLVHQREPLIDRHTVTNLIQVEHNLAQLSIPQ